MKIIEGIWELEHRHLGRPQGNRDFREESDFSGSQDYEESMVGGGDKKGSGWGSQLTKGPIFLGMHKCAAD